jgi:hypothetical protein
MIDLVTQFKDRRPGARPAAARLGLRGARRGGAPMLPCPIARRRVNTAVTGPGLRRGPRGAAAGTDPWRSDLSAVPKNSVQVRGQR